MKTNPQCGKCRGIGRYQYTTHGTPHSKMCEDCCEHEGAPWAANDNGYYCAAGCGKLMWYGSN
jgi:hypothetical protein